MKRGVSRTVPERKRSYKRGYPVAVLVGLEESHAVLWHVFSEVVKPHVTIDLVGRRKDEMALYNFHESVVDALRPAFREGVRSVVVAAPTRTNYAAELLYHVRKHHSWLVEGRSTNVGTFGELVGSADTPSEVADLVKTREFRKLVNEVTSGEAGHIVDILEKRLNDIGSGGTVLYSLEEIENLIYRKWKHSNLKPECLALTDRYLAECKEKNRIHRLLQIAKNKNVRTRVVSAETTAGKRLSQFGGLVCFTELN